MIFKIIFCIILWILFNSWIWTIYFILNDYVITDIGDLLVYLIISIIGFAPTMIILNLAKYLKILLDKL